MSLQTLKNIQKKLQKGYKEELTAVQHTLPLQNETEGTLPSSLFNQSPIGGSRSTQKCALPQHPNSKGSSRHFSFPPQAGSPPKVQSIVSPTNANDTLCLSFTSPKFNNVSLRDRSLSYCLSEEKSAVAERDYGFDSANKYDAIKQEEEQNLSQDEQKRSSEQIYRDLTNRVHNYIQSFQSDCSAFSRRIDALLRE